MQVLGFFDVCLASFFFLCRLTHVPLMVDPTPFFVSGPPTVCFCSLLAPVPSSQFRPPWFIFSSKLD